MNIFHDYTCRCGHVINVYEYFQKIKEVREVNT